MNKISEFSLQEEISGLELVRLLIPMLLNLTLLQILRKEGFQGEK